MRRHKYQKMACFVRFRDPDLRLSLVLLALVLATAGGCQQSGKPDANKEVVPTYNADTGRLERISYDRNKDGKPDAWLFMDGTLAIRAELDENHDGAIDRWEHYRTGAATAIGIEFPRSELLKAEQATRLDGKVNRWETYESGRLAQVKEDTNNDGRPDKWEVWTDGSLAEVALDTAGRGKPDRRIVYPPDGSSPQMLEDATGDGTFRPMAPTP